MLSKSNTGWTFTRGSRMIPVLSTSSRDRKGRQGQVCHWKGESIFSMDICWQKFHWLHILSREGGWDWGWVVYCLTRSHSTLQRLLWIEPGWMANSWLCCSDTSTFATCAISAISGVLNGLQIKLIKLFAVFAFIDSRIFLWGYN